MSTLASFKIPKVDNEPNHHYAKSSHQRRGLEAAVNGMQKRLPLQVPIVVGGKQVNTPNTGMQVNPANHSAQVANYSRASSDDVSRAISAALNAKPEWESMPFESRAAIFLKAADLIATKYRYEIMAAAMLGQGKNSWQAEIDAAAELADFFRFNVKYAQQLYATQPEHNATGVWNRVEYRPLEGFIYAISPFNFTAIGGNLPGAPALMGNVVVWKPSDFAIASNWLVYQVMLEAGLPKNVIQFIPGDPVEVTNVVLKHREFAGLHYTGSTAVFRKLWGAVGEGVAESRFRGYPRVVGETGGKNFHLLGPSADVENAVIHTVRGAFEYSGQKCSATSRCYVPKSLWPQFRARLVEEVGHLKVGDPTKAETFMGPVIHRASFDKLKSFIDKAKTDSGLDLVCGGQYDGSKGYFVHPTVYQVSSPDHSIMKTELFGPILGIYVYDDSEAGAVEKICQTVDAAGDYALTGSVFAQNRAECELAEEKLRHSAGNFYINCKSTGAVVGQQPFGGARASGTNDKAGSASLLGRFVSIRSIKEEFIPAGSVSYPSNEV